MPWALHDSAFTRAFEDLAVHDAIVGDKQAAADHYVSWRAVNNPCAQVATAPGGRIDLLEGLVAVAIDERDRSTGWVARLGDRSSGTRGPSVGCARRRSSRRDARAVPVQSRMELIAALGSGDFDRLLHTAEGAWFDFKEAAPDVKSPKGRRDFLADVAAFANAQGGVLLFGATGRIDESMNQEVVGQVIGVNCARVNFDQLLKLVREHIRPVLHVEIRRFGHDDGRSVVVVNVEAQADGPFLVDRVGAGDTVVPHGFGWPVRHGDGTHWETLDRVQQLISTALRLQASHNSIVPPGGDRDAEAVADLELLDRLLADQDDHFRLWPWYSVQAIPTRRGAQIVDFYGEYMEAARHWRSVRENGFDLGLDWTPLTPAAGQRATAVTTRHGVVVSRTGVLTTGSVGSPEFLGWANHQRTPLELLEHVEINPFVIVEFTAETLRFAADFISPRLDGPSGWRFVARGHRLAGSERSKALYLRERPRRWMAGGFFDDPKPPLGDSFEVEVTSSDDTLADAYRLLGEVYGAGWGSSPTRVPFATDGRIDFELMAST